MLESRDEILLRGEGCNTPVLIVPLITIYLANRGLKFVVNANRVRLVNIYLAVFDLVFVLDLSSKSTSAQNESCRSSFSLQLLFWPNFKFLYEKLSFNLSNSS